MSASPAAESGDETLRMEIEEQRAHVQSLMTAAYSQANPASGESFELLVQEEQKLRELERIAREQRQAAEKEHGSSKQGGSAPDRGRVLGATNTAGLTVTTKICMEGVPIGAYHLLDPSEDPLATVNVKFETSGRGTWKRLRVTAYLEGLSAKSVETVELRKGGEKTCNLLPTLLPGKAELVHEIMRATLHVIVDDVTEDVQFVTHNTYTITCLARTASFNSVRDPATGEVKDFSHFYGAWVTPHVAQVQERVRRAVDLIEDRRFVGYQGEESNVSRQVAAIYRSLQELKLSYVNSVIDFGAPSGVSTQRTRLPRESIEQLSANCIDGTVLMASMLEGISLNPAIVLIPGHALLGWETWRNSNKWEYLETVMIGDSDFDAACRSGTQQYNRFGIFDQDRIKRLSLADLRRRGVYPME